MKRLSRTVASVIAAITMAAGFTVVAASADTLVLTHNCGGIWTPLHTRVIETTISAPATASPGQTITVTVNRIVDRNNVQSEARPAGYWKATARVRFGEGPDQWFETTRMSSPALQAGEYFRVENGTAQVTMPASGQLDFRPAGWLLSPNPGWMCWPKDQPVPVAATTRVQ
ncbi:MAG TPA: hypothetical protein VGX25_06005 [Actinophytocola sp.]|uniref:hypothetical protein n=1 Tax=Actinophytocola sp. TaxID=1872138 RepID=UPI002DDD0A73|nr:hypothetical protein [Actinophytocola sp.]HEV2778939.1 hypothetical protein [Actinophytocola sp.]